VEICPWSELEKKVGKDKLQGFDSSIALGEIVVEGLAMDGVFYLKSCPSVAGELAHCARQRFGVWSVTKAAANAAALLHLAQKYGPDVFEAKLVDYVKEAAAYPGWAEVTFGDALNMATWIGNGSTKTDPNEIGDGELDETYPQWYEARS
jgi:CubicO group peptidase (beta-lactamase class C family)